MDRKKELENIRSYWRTPNPAHRATAVHDVLILLEELDRLEAIEAAARKVDDEEDCLRDDCNIFGRDSIMSAASRKRRNEALTNLHFVLEHHKRQGSR